MRKKHHYLSGLASGVMLLAASQVIGADVGDPAKPTSIKNARAEVIYEQYDRDVQISDTQTEAITPEGTFSFSVEGHEATQEEDRLLLRVSVPVGTKVILFGEVGVTDSEGSDDPTAIFGGGFRAIAYESSAVDAAIFGAIDFVPKIEYSETDYDPDWGMGEATQEESYWEASGGISLSRVIPLENDSRLVPYGGVMLSILQGDEDFYIKYPDAGITGNGTADLEDDGVFSIFGGCSFLFNESIGVRVEGRFVNQTSISAALACNF